VGEARYHVAIRRSEDDAVLVLEDGAMPGVSVTDAPPWQVVEPVVDALRVDHGLRVEALRTAWHGEPDGEGRVDRLVEVSLVGGRLPEGARWVPLDALDRRPTPLGRAIEATALVSRGLAG
jgi:hypothetical protein